MIVDYSQESSLTEAFADTFSGEKPCSLCKKITAAKESDSRESREPIAPVPTKSFHDLFPPSTVSLKDPFSSPFTCPAFAVPGDPTFLPASGPPAPPPRC